MGWNVFQIGRIYLIYPSNHRGKTFYCQLAMAMERSFLYDLYVSKPCGKTTLSTKKILLYRFVALSMCHPVLIKLLLLQHKWISFTTAGLVLAFSISSASSCRAFKGNFSPLLTTKMKLVGCYGIARPTENSLGRSLARWMCENSQLNFQLPCKVKKNTYLYFSSPNAIECFPPVSNTILYSETGAQASELGSSCLKAECSYVVSRPHSYISPGIWPSKARGVTAHRAPDDSM